MNRYAFFLVLLLLLSLFGCSDDASVPSGDSSESAIPLGMAEQRTGVINGPEPGYWWNSRYFKITIDSAGYYSFNLHNLAGNANLYLLRSDEIIITSSLLPNIAPEAVSSYLNPGSYFMVIAALVDTTYTVAWYPGENSIGVLSSTGISNLPSIYSSHGYKSFDYDIAPINSTISYSCDVSTYDFETATSNAYSGLSLVDVSASWIHYSETNTSGTVSLYLGEAGMRTIGFYVHNAPKQYSIEQRRSLLAYIDRVHIISNDATTRTFLTRPENFFPDATGHTIYLAGQMNFWAGSEVSVTNLPNIYSIAMTNRGDDTFVAVVTNAEYGMQYKYIIDYNDNGFIDDQTEWKYDPANPYLYSMDQNSVIH